jgi:hypothetical protein
MLSVTLVEEIDRLLQEGKLSQRKIAARLKVSRGTVGSIASGRRGLYGHESQLAQEDPLRHEGPPERCPHCGFRVYMPCLVCRIRAYRESQHRTEGNPPAPGRRPARRRSGPARVA